MPTPLPDIAGHCLLAGAVARMGSVPGERWRAESDAAAVCARYLACHPRVVWVRYPGLPGDPDFEEAARTLVSGFGPAISYGTTDGCVRLLTCAPCDPLALVASLEASFKGSRA